MLADTVTSNGEPSLRARRSQCSRGDSNYRDRMGNHMKYMTRIAIIERIFTTVKK
jgi:hypothetical protein